MITKSEIELKASEFEIHTSNVERDYVYGWILFGIFTSCDLKDYIFLKGGNALRKAYFANTRYSRDLDFGIPSDIDPDFLLSEINKVCSTIEEKTGITFISDKNKVEEKFTVTEVPIPGLRVYELSLFFKDFYGNPDRIRLKISMDITRFDAVMLPLQNMQLIHPYSDNINCSCEVTCMKLEEIIATKLKCLMQRQHAPDLFDYVYSIRQLGGNLNSRELVEVLVRKTIFSRNPQMLKRILADVSFGFFREHWQKTVECARQFLFGVEEAIKIFLENLEEIFSSYRENGFAQFAYFAPEFRTPILEAGRKQKLLKVRYKGETRIVEPYSLKYLERKDGHQQEYLYVYNRSGGKNKPGPRNFVASNLQSIELMEETFEPRFLIELSKAGEKPENPYLFDPNKPIKKSKLLISPYSRFRKASGIKYVYQCAYCGKQFTRSTRNATLRPHKSKNGFHCHGIRGIYVTTKY